MAAVIYIGDEISAAGWRLAGAQILAPAAGSESAALAQACAGAELVLVSAATAVHIDAKALRRATAAYIVFIAAKLDPTAMMAETKKPRNWTGAAELVCCA
jgi:vacuolar-type H+-ATPase subunit F/Vma7